MKKNILVIGNGRIARAVGLYLKQSGFFKGVRWDARARGAASADLLVGSMPGDLGHIPLETALRYRKPLVDISDMDPGYFLKNRPRIERARITVVPACGFCPGLINFIVGREKARLGSSIRTINIAAGSLSPVPEYFPFLWCFEDLVLEHTLSSDQIIRGRRRRFPAFAGYRHEAFDGIAGESYFTQSGFENMMEGLKLEECTYRVIRPRGFGVFYRFLRSEGFLSGRNAMITKSIVESNVRDNVTLGRVEISSKRRKVVWTLRSSSRASEGLNSMQKITAATPAAVACCLAREGLPSGLVFLEDVSGDDTLLNRIIDANRSAGVRMVRRETKL